MTLLKEAIKEKLKIANKEKVKFLTITPVSWSIQQTANFCINSNGEESKKIKKKAVF